MEIMLDNSPAQIKETGIRVESPSKHSSEYVTISISNNGWQWNTVDIGTRDQAIRLVDELTRYIIADLDDQIESDNERGAR